MKNKFYTVLKIILYCLLAISVVICARAVILSCIAASADDEATPVLTVMVAFYMLFVYSHMPVAFADMIYCVRYFETDKKTSVKTVANCFFILLSLGMIVSTVLMICGVANTNSPVIIFIYLALRLSYLITVRIQKRT